MRKTSFFAFLKKLLSCTNYLHKKGRTGFLGVADHEAAGKLEKFINLIINDGELMMANPRW